MLKNFDLGQVVFQIVLAFISSGGIAIFLNWRIGKKMLSLKAKIESNTHITNLHYEREYVIIQEVWIKYICLKDEVNDYIEEMSVINSTKIEDAKLKYHVMLQTFSKFLLKHKPFIDKEIYEKFEEKASNFIRAVQSSQFDELGSDKHDGIPKRIEIEEDDLINIVYKYLNAFKVNLDK